MNANLINKLRDRQTVVEANLGDLFIQSYLTFHRTGHNSSNRVRFTLIGRYLNVHDKNFNGCNTGVDELQ